MCNEVNILILIHDNFLVEWIKEFSNTNLEEIVTPIDCNKLEQLLQEVDYDPKETEYLCNSFRHGFDLGYRGPMKRKDTAPNLPFRVGNATILWNKVMDEVKQGRYAGPFEKIPYKNAYVQSPIGLVSKDGNKTRLIFHLSYKFPKWERIYKLLDTRTTQ